MMPQPRSVTEEPDRRRPRATDGSEPQDQAISGTQDCSLRP
jgi:hypothetical protein